MFVRIFVFGRIHFLPNPFWAEKKISRQKYIEPEKNFGRKHKKWTGKKNETKCFLSNEGDSFDCYVEIHAGAGGTESQDWAEMLRRMYVKWSNNKNFKFQIISEHKGDEAGIKSSTIKIEGEYVYGLLKKTLQSSRSTRNLSATLQRLVLRAKSAASRTTANICEPYRKRKHEVRKLFND